VAPSKARAWDCPTQLSAPIADLPGFSGRYFQVRRGRRRRRRRKRRRRGC
jgi:hypothetical protein